MKFLLSSHPYQIFFLLMLYTYLSIVHNQKPDPTTKLTTSLTPSFDHQPDLQQCSPQQPAGNLSGLAIISNSNFLLDINGSIAGGNLYDIFAQIWKDYNTSVTYDTMILSTKSSELTSIIELVSNKTYDFALGYPVVANSGNDDTDDLKQYNIASIGVQQDSAVIFLPNILQLLVGNVLQEMFFAICIVLLPWFLVSTFIFYLIELRKFSKVEFFRGFIDSFKTITFRGDEMSLLAKVYSIIFFIITGIIAMLLLGDFIYVIASMLLTLDLSGASQVVNSQSTTCVIQDDYLILDFLEQRPEIPAHKSTDIYDCLAQLRALNFGAFMVSSSKIQSFLHDNPDQNNRFDFFQRDSIKLEYTILINTDLRIDDDINMLMGTLNSKFLTNIHNEYYTKPYYNQIIPSSIFSNSILLIFLSLTITSIFLLIFLVVMLCRQTKSRRRKNSQDSVETRVRERVVRVRKYLFVRQNSRSIRRRALDIEEDLENTDQYYYSTENKENKYGQQEEEGRVQRRSLSYRNRAKDQSLSLSGPIQSRKFEEKPDKSWSKNNGKSSYEENDMESQKDSNYKKEVSPIRKVEESGNKSNCGVFDQEKLERRGDEVQGKVLMDHCTNSVLSRLGHNNCKEKVV